MLTLTGDDLSALSQPGGFQEMLIGVGEFQLIGDVNDAAAQLGLAPEMFASTAVRRFLERADDDAWTSLLSRLHDSSAPMAMAVAVILHRAVADVKEVCS